MRERDETPATPTLAERPERPAKPRKPARQGPTELQKAEARVSELEKQVAEIEARLAEDWTNLDVLAAHTAAREELSAQLARWEELFETVHKDA